MSATVSEVSGTCELYNPNTGSWITLNNGFIAAEGDLLRTADNSSFKLTDNTTNTVLHVTKLTTLQMKDPQASDEIRILDFDLSGYIYYFLYGGNATNSFRIPITGGTRG